MGAKQASRCGGATEIPVVRFGRSSHMKYSLSLVAAAFALTACSDSLAPRHARGVASPSRSDVPLMPQDVFQRYVALGTSNSMGVQSAGIFAAGQRAAWPAQLAAHVGVPFSLPLEQDPGCGPPLLPPL